MTEKKIVTTRKIVVEKLVSHSEAWNSVQPFFSEHLLKYPEHYSPEALDMINNYFMLRRHGYFYPLDYQRGVIDYCLRVLLRGYNFEPDELKSLIEPFRLINTLLQIEEKRLKIYESFRRDRKLFLGKDEF